MWFAKLSCFLLELSVVFLFNGLHELVELILIARDGSTQENLGNLRRKGWKCHYKSIKLVETFRQASPSFYVFLPVSEAHLLPCLKIRCSPKTSQSINITRWENTHFSDILAIRPTDPSSKIVVYLRKITHLRNKIEFILLFLVLQSISNGSGTLWREYTVIRECAVNLMPLLSLFV